MKSNNHPGEPAGIVRELTVGEVAQRSGLTVSALHFYESKGLIASQRNRGNQRRYPRTVLRQVAIIKVAQSTGVPLSAIRDALASLPKGRPPTGLGETVSQLARRSRRTHRQADPFARPARLLHRMRLPLTKNLPAAQSFRSAFEAGLRSKTARPVLATSDRHRLLLPLFRLRMLPCRFQFVPELSYA